MILLGFPMLPRLKCPKWLYLMNHEGDKRLARRPRWARRRGDKGTGQIIGNIR
jgi:hypothetical protein